MFLFDKPSLGKIQTKTAWTVFGLRKDVLFPASDKYYGEMRGLVVYFEGTSDRHSPLGGHIFLTTMGTIISVASFCERLRLIFRILFVGVNELRHVQ